MLPLCLCASAFNFSLAFAEAPATAPASDSYAPLIQQLGDDDFAVREAATSKLMQAGEDARAALSQAARDGSPEQRERAAEILRNLESRPFPGPAPADLGIDPTYSVRVSPDGHSKDVAENGRTIHIDEGEAGIDMTVSGFINGKPVTERYHAATPDALRRLSPDAYDEWRSLESNANNGAGQVVVQQLPNGQQVIIHGGGRVIFNGGQLVDPSDDKDLQDLTENLQQQISDKKLTDAQRGPIMQGLEQVKAADDAVRQKVDPDQRKLQDVYLKACDDLRKQLADAGLPDPGPLLPPPDGVRLGVTMDGESDPVTGGLMITVVSPGSRGQKIGLLAEDVVHAINGQPISTVRDLRAALMKNPSLELDITRGGQEMTLKEKAPAADATK